MKPDKKLDQAIQSIFDYVKGRDCKDCRFSIQLIPHQDKSRYRECGLGGCPKAWANTIVKKGK